MAVPLLDEERVLGVLQVLDRPQRARFSLQEMELLGLFATQAAIALVTARPPPGAPGRADRRRRRRGRRRARGEARQPRGRVQVVGGRAAPQPRPSCSAACAAEPAERREPRRGGALVVRTRILFGLVRAGEPRRRPRCRRRSSPGPPSCASTSSSPSLALFGLRSRPSMLSLDVVVGLLCLVAYLSSMPRPSRPTCQILLNRTLNPRRGLHTLDGGRPKIFPRSSIASSIDAILRPVERSAASSLSPSPRSAASSRTRISGASSSPSPAPPSGTTPSYRRDHASTPSTRRRDRRRQSSRRPAGGRRRRSRRSRHRSPTGSGASA